MECTRRYRNNVNQTFEIHVCVSDSSAGIATSERLRFALLDSPWFLKPFGIVLWSLLHVLLVVAGASLLVLAAVSWLALSLFWDIIWLPHCAFIVCCLLLWGIVCLIWSLMRLSWSLIFEGERLQQIWDACRRFVDWWDPSKVPSRGFRCQLLETVSWLGLHSTREYVKGTGEWLSPWCILLGRWCEEVVHMHDTICI
ncbi:hypothetical protein KC19_10G131100 [Ceratodon purpureus]|uniref:Uncharacterized protein n=1 Tax=Ceratodon purpureus TaxID=3225 RepID=A0A8T0GLE5_CERPU|nr:hypothetical protein KC19_10G131100 [Ceratodon purpureus]